MAVAIVTMTATIASAQPVVAPQVTVGGLDGSSLSRIAEGRPFGNSVTPTMKREKLRQALALRDEAAALLAADGGRLSPAHVAYVRKRSDEIRFGRLRPAQTGSLVACR